MEIDRAFIRSMLRWLVELLDLLGKYGGNNMVWVAISNQDRLKFVELGLCNYIINIPGYTNNQSAVLLGYWLQAFTYFYI